MREKCGQMGLHGFEIETRQHLVVVGISFNLGTIQIEFLTPHQAGLLALLNYALEEAPEGIYPIAVTDARQA